MGADGCLELQLRNVMGRQRRSREVVPHRSLAEDSREACPHLRSARRAEGGLAAPGETGGAVATAGLRNGGPGAQLGARFGAGEGDRQGPGLGHGGGDATLGAPQFAVTAGARVPSRPRHRPAAYRRAGETHRGRRQAHGQTCS